VIDDALGDEVRVTVIAAGFDGGTPTVRRDVRALGQVGGAAATVPPAPRPAPVGSHSSAPAAQGDLQPVGSRTPNPEVPAFLSADLDPVPLTGSLEVPKLFTEPVQRVEHEELDVPDFLK
jgi:cell division protein FtsZ